MIILYYIEPDAQRLEKRNDRYVQCAEMSVLVCSVVYLSPMLTLCRHCSTGTAVTVVETVEVCMTGY